MHSLLIIDDDTELCALLEDYLEREGFEVRSIHTASQALDMMDDASWDLVILDINLPDMNGFDLLARIRAASQLPVLILSGREDDVDRVVGLEMGADDYQIKPFHARELVARIRTILRRAALAETRCDIAPPLLEAGDLTVDRRKYTAWLGEKKLCLTQVEFAILVQLVEADGEVVSREKISHHALGRTLSPLDRSIDVHMSNLRRKLGPREDGGKRIRTVRGAGYAYLASNPDAGSGSASGSTRSRRAQAATKSSGSKAAA